MEAEPDSEEEVVGSSPWDDIPPLSISLSPDRVTGRGGC